MGQYLKQAYEERDLAIALAKVHGLIDDNTQKLSDKVKNLTLLHNRMRKLLKMVLKFLDDPYWNIDDVVHLHKLVTLELYGLENYKGVQYERKIGSDK